MRAICAIVASLALAGTVTADTINVPADYPTIQGAVDAANNGDEIVVAPGTYTSTQDGHVVDMKGKAITLRSSDGPEVTIIDGENARRGIACVNGESELTVIDGLTITNALTVYFDYSNDGIEDWWEFSGGGLIFHNCSASVTNCVIQSNISNERGGGVFILGGIGPRFNNCTFSNNYSLWDGGGFYCYNSEPIFGSCSIIDNVADQYYGGGGYCHTYSSAKIINCNITGNTSNYYGGGLYCWNSSPSISGSLFVNNTAQFGAGINSMESSNPTLMNTSVCGNVSDQLIGSWIDYGGNYIADDCSDGACCFDDYCLVTTEFECSGTWIGMNTSCEINPCISNSIHVPQDYPTIQGAINASFNGDVIQIAAGTYNEHDLNPGGKAITIQGTVNTNGTIATTIDAQQAGGVFVINSGEADDTLIQDLRITGGSASNGGGISCTNSNPTITGCTIEGNTADNNGGGIYCEYGNPTITGSTVCGNTPLQIAGSWTDGGENDINTICQSGPCPPFDQEFNYESINEGGAIEMAVSGDLAVVLEDGPDQEFWNVLCYHRTQGQWQLEAVRQSPRSTGILMLPCKRVDFSGDFVIVRPDLMSPGGYSIFNRDGGNWTLEYTSAEDSDMAPFEMPGLSVSISGDIATTGDASLENGECVIHHRDSTGTWSQQSVLTSPIDNINWFGVDTAVDGNNLIVSTLSDGAFAYQYDGSSWQYRQHLTHPDVTKLGTSVDISGNVAVIGSQSDLSPSGTEGAVVFRLVLDTWVPEQRLDSPGVTDLGYSVRIDGDMIVATSGINYQNTPLPGQAHVFRYDGVAWIEIDTIEGYYVTEAGWVTSPRISISGLQIATAYYNESVVQFQDITLRTYPPPGELSGLDCNANDRCDELDIASGSSDDCNGNAVPDECDIADGISIDENADGIPDECQCLGDINSDGEVGVDDVLLLLSDFGSDCTDGCDSDLNGDGQVTVDDILALLGYYGTACP